MKRLALFSLLSLLSGLVMSACSEGGVVRPHDARVDNSPQSCGPGSCNGCCLGTICTEGSALSACGMGGMACLECGTGMICQT
ncbi:MAG: hypothetical protein KAI47_01660, partial [Deltaproteobacteria bacterium]|nr:hypothetical protein [Deltaproteobacteria bacterium]